MATANLMAVQSTGNTAKTAQAGSTAAKRNLVGGKSGNKNGGNFDDALKTAQTSDEQPKVKDIKDVAKEAAAGKAKVAGAIGPSGRFIAPLGDLDFEDAYNSFYTQAAALTEAGADYIIIETCIDLQEMRAALLAAK
mgnify:CR=1 FL=1